LASSSSTGKRQKVEGMQLVDIDDDDVKVGRGGGSKGIFVGGRREKLADVVFRQALRKFDQKVLLATSNVYIYIYIYIYICTYTLRPK
jgi:hypothetical protein